VVELSSYDHSPSDDILRLFLLGEHTGRVLDTQEICKLLDMNDAVVSGHLRRKITNEILRAELLERALYEVLGKVEA